MGLRQGAGRKRGEGEVPLFAKLPQLTTVDGHERSVGRDGKRRQEKASDGWSGCVLACMEPEM